MLYRRETARNDLKSARALFFIEDYKGANNGAYYSIFHAINAVHAVSGKAYKRHKDASVAAEFIDLAEKYCMEQLQERKMTQ